MIEDCDYPDCVGALWGEINTTVHKGLGVSGAVTNGVMRDFTEGVLIAGSIGLSHAFVHVKEMTVLMGLSVAEGDLPADRHGA